MDEALAIRMHKDVKDTNLNYLRAKGIWKPDNNALATF